MKILVGLYNYYARRGNVDGEELQEEVIVVGSLGPAGLAILVELPKWLAT